MNIIEAACDPNLFGPFFKDEQTWSGWRTFLKILFGIPLNGGERQLFRECTGRETPSKGGHSEAWLVIGRRGGKSFVLALIAVFLASFRDWRPFLGPGEVATIMVIAQDRRQACQIAANSDPLFASKNDPSDGAETGNESWRFKNRA